jgi:GNAT superfamily N-acetyltransferase
MPRISAWRWNIGMSTHKDGPRSSGMRDEYVYLADRPDLIPLLASWFYNEWGVNDPHLSLETITGKLKGRLHREHLPLVLVLLRDNSPIASASLKIQEMDTHPQYLHWLGSVYVLPEMRHQGIGSKLVQSSVSEARRLGIKELYLYTRHREAFYARLGWKPIERPDYRGRPAVIMSRNLMEIDEK